LVPRALPLPPVPLPPVPLPPVLAPLSLLPGGELGGARRSRRISAELGDVLEAQLQHGLDLVELLGRELRERSR